MPVYQLLGGAARDGVLAYGHAIRLDLPQLFDSIQNHLDQGFQAIRVQTGVPGLGQVYGVATDQHRGTLRLRTGPTDRRAHRGDLGHPRLPAPRAHRVRRRARRVRPRDAAAARRPPPADAEPGRELGKSLEPYDLFWLEDCTPAENQAALRLVRQHTTTPLAIGEVFNTVWDYQTLITEQLIDYVRSRRHARRRHHRAGRILTSRRSTRSSPGFHGPTDISPVGHGRRAAPRHRHPQLRHPGVHEAHRATPSRFPHQLHLHRRAAAPWRPARAWASTSTKKLAATSRTTPAYLPVNRLQTARCTTGSPPAAREMPLPAVRGRILAKVAFREQGAVLVSYVTGFIGRPNPGR